MTKGLKRTILALALALCAALPTYLVAQPVTQVSGGSTTGTLGAGRLLLGYGTTASSILQVARTQLTNAQVKALQTAAITVIPAPGTGTIVDVLGGMIVFNYTTAYTETGGNDNWRLYYRTSGDEPATNVIETTGFVDATADSIIKFGPVPNDQVIAGAELTNVAVVLSGVTGTTYNDLGGGAAANTVTVHVLYRTITTGL